MNQQTNNDKIMKYEFFESKPEYQQPKDYNFHKVSVKDLLFKFSDRLDKILMFFGSICAMAFGLVMPSFSLIFGDLINAFNEPLNVLYQNITKYSLYFLYIGVGSFVVNYVSHAFWMLSAERQTNRIRELYLKAMLRQDIGWYDIVGAEKLVSRISSDPIVIQRAIGLKMASLIQFLTTFIYGFILGFVRGWKLTLVILSITPLLVISGAFMMKMMSSLSNKEQKAYASAGAVAAEVISSIRTVASFTGEERETKRYGENLIEAKNFGIKRAFFSGLGIGLTMFIFFGAYGLAFWYGGVLVINNEYNGGEVLTVFFSVVIGAFALGQATPSLEDLSKAQGAAYKIFDTINRNPPIDAFSNEGLKPENIEGNIELKDIDFCYPTRPNIKIFDKLNLSIKSGQTLALVGPSGSGKSSIISLIQRFYDPLNGLIKIDNYNIKDLNIKWIRNQIGLVGQEPVLFVGTIAENIKYGKPDATIEEIENAAKLANAHNFIIKFPDKYNTFVGERGAQLSGGQKQRIAIARAIIKNPKILLLDEATSALDTESEKIVQEALDKVMKGRTTIVVAHRLTTVKDANTIAVINKGKVEEIGTHQELLKKNGLYKELVKAQQIEEENLEKNIDKNQDNIKKKGKLNNKSKIKKIKIDVIDESSDKDKIIKENENEISLWRIFKYNKPEIYFFLFGIFGAIINGSSNPAFAIVFSKMVNVYYQSDSQIEYQTKIWAGSFAAIGFAVFIANLFQAFFFGIAGEKLTERLRNLSFKSILQQNIGWFDLKKNNTSALTNKLSTDASLVQGLLGVRLGITVQNIVTIIAGLTIAFIYGWKLTLVILAISPLIIFANVMEMYSLQGYSKQSQDSTADANQLAREAITNIRTVASFTLEEKTFESYKEKLQKPYKLGVKSSQIAGFLTGLGQFVLFASYTLSFWYGGKLVSEREMSFLHVLTVFMSIVLSAMSVGQTTAFLPDQPKAKEAAKNIFEFIDSKSLIDPFSDEGKTLNEKFNATVEFKNVKFAYPTRPGATILKHFNLLIPNGKIVALVGPSGCGKSSCIQLIERFYDPIKGEITLDGVDIKQLNVKWLRNQIGLVGQEPVLFEGTIAENIKYGKPDATIEEIENAAKLANAHNFIIKFPDKYNTFVGERGAQLSGGQKQRIAIARAIIKNPKILLLDEATSALDTESEKIVQEALDKVMKGRTTIVIAHRLSTIKNADIIATIHQGHVAELGTHEELMKLKGIYFNLVQRQTN